MGEPKIENDRRNAVGAPPPHNLAPGHPTDGSSICVCVCVLCVGVGSPYYVSCVRNAFAVKVARPWGVCLCSGAVLQVLAGF